MRGVPRGVALPIALLIASAQPAAAQSVADIVNRMYEAAERYSQGVENYTLVQSVMGFETATYFEKEMVDGRPVFRARQTSANVGGMSSRSQTVGYGDVGEIGPDLVEHGRYAGRDEVDGHAVHVIEVDDLAALDLEAPSGPDDMEFVAKSGRFYVDAEMYVPRRMSFEGEATTDTGVHEVTTVVDMLDYREVQGLLVPYRNVISIEGLDAMLDPDMQARLEEMEAQLEGLDPERRAMIEQMLGPQIEQIKAMAAGDGQPMTMEVTVTEVRVNQGPPRG